MKQTKPTTVQISINHRNMLKKYCDIRGLKMNKFIENMIEEKIKNDKSSNSTR